MAAGLELAISCLAIACGGLCIPLNPGLAEPELLSLLEDSGADAVMGMPGDPMPTRLGQALGLASLVFDMREWLLGHSAGATDRAASWPTRPMRPSS